MKKTDGEASLSPPRTHETLLAAAILLLAGLLAYSSSFAGGFIWDDNYFFLCFFQNKFQMSQLWGYLTSPVGQGRPVASLSLAVNYALCGREVWGYHAFNLAAHLLGAMTLFGIIRRTLRSSLLRKRFGRDAAWLALAAALIWLVHPLQTESVTYIWQRCESLAGLFYLLTLYCVIRGAEAQPIKASSELSAPSAEQQSNLDSPLPPPRPAPNLRWYVLAILACALGLGCKPILVTAPMAVYAYDRIFLAGDTAIAWRKRWPLYMGLAATWLFLASLLLMAPNFQILPGQGEISSSAYAQTQLGIILQYLRLSFWPVGLCLDYDWPVAQRWEEILPGALVIGTLAAATLWAWFHHPAWSFPGFWFFIILAPTSSFLPLLKNLAYEHRMYLSLAGLVTPVVAGFYLLGAALLRRLSFTEEQRRKWGGLAAAGALAAVTALLGWLTCQRNTLYHDPIAMWKEVLRQRPKNWRPNYEIGRELNARGQRNEAIENFNKALALNPCLGEACIDRGIARQAGGDLDGAIQDFSRALEINPLLYPAYYNRSIARRERGDLDGALADFSKILEFNPHDAGAFYGRGSIRHEKGDLDGALADFSKALEFSEDAATFYSRGCIRHEKGDLNGAIADFSKALEINPGLGYAYGSRGVARHAKGDVYGAILDFNKALELSPRNGSIWMNKGLTLILLGKESEAEACFEKGLEIEPGAKKQLNQHIARTYIVLASFLLTCPDEKRRNYPKALTDAEKAKSLDGGKDPNILDTLALAYFKNDRPGEAANTQAEAIRLLSADVSAQQRKDFEDRLKEYEAGSLKKK